jgi:hypothetical protein
MSVKKSHYEIVVRLDWKIARSGEKSIELFIINQLLNDWRIDGEKG